MYILHLYKCFSQKVKVVSGINGVSVDKRGFPLKNVQFFNGNSFTMRKQKLWLSK